MLKIKKMLVTILAVSILAGCNSNNKASKKGCPENDTLFMLCANNGFYFNNNSMAYLSGDLHNFEPAHPNDKTGTVDIDFCEKGQEVTPQVRLWSTAEKNQKVIAEFHLETFLKTDTNNFIFTHIIPMKGCDDSLNCKQTIIGCADTTLKFEFSTNSLGDAEIGLFAAATSARKQHSNPNPFFRLKKIVVIKSK